MNSINGSFSYSGYAQELKRPGRPEEPSYEEAIQESFVKSDADGRTIKEICLQIKDKITETASDTKDKLISAKNKAEEKITDAKEKLLNAKDRAEEKLYELKDSAEHKITEIKNEIIRFFNPLKMEGTSGNDTITLSQDNAGNLIVNINGEEKTLSPEEAKRLVISSGAGDDFIYADGSVDYSLLIKAGNGNNVIFGGNGNDKIKAGNGNNEIHGGNGNDKIKTGNGNSLIYGEGGSNQISAGNGNNIIFSSDEEDSYFAKGSGGTLDQKITAGNGNNVMFAGFGDNRINAGHGSNVITAGDFHGIHASSEEGAIILTAGGSSSGGNMLIGEEYSLRDKNDHSVSEHKKAKAPIVIHGTEGSDSISITQKENGWLSVNMNGKLSNYRPSEAKSLIFMTGSGNDAIIADSSVKYDLHIIAGNGNNTIQTGSGNDLISVGNGNNRIIAGKGNDMIIAGNGNNTIDSGSGNDIITAGKGNNTIYSGKTDGASSVPDKGNDIINAGKGGNTVTAGNGTNVINLGNGSDSVTVGNGKNFINTAGGNDTVNAGRGNDLITTSNGNDTINAGHGNNIIFAAGGDNRISAGAGDNKITTGSGNDSITAGNGNNRINSGAGHDTINAGNGNNYINAGSGNDFISAGNGNNVIYAMSGDDSIAAGNGNNFIFAGKGDDALTTGLGHNIISAGAGKDMIDASKGSNIIFDDADSANIYEGSNKKNEIHLYDPKSYEKLGSSIKIKEHDDIGRPAPGFKERLEEDLELFKVTESGRKMLEALDASGKKVTIQQLRPETDNGFASTSKPDNVYIKNGKPGKGSNSLISYNPSFYDTFDGTDFLPPVVLFHEMAHSYNHVTGTMQPGLIEAGGDMTKKSEHQAVGLPTEGIAVKHPDGSVTDGNPDGLNENSIRKELGLPNREQY